MRRLASIAVALAIVLGTQPAFAAATVRRIAGNDRYSTAAAVALDRWDHPSDVVLANGANPADALAGSYVSGLHSSPVFLAAPRSS